MLWCVSAIAFGALSIQSSLNTKALYYSPGETVPITLAIENTGSEGYQLSSIKTDWLSMKALDYEGKEQNVFTALSISVQVGKRLLDVKSSAGDFDPHADLNITDAWLQPGAKLVYTINAKVNVGIRSPITFQAMVEGVPTSGLTVPSGILSVSASKSSDVTAYLPGQPVVFSVRLVNDGQIPVIYGRVTDAISAIQTTDIFGNTVPAFSRVQSIVATTDSAWSSAGDFSPTGPDLQATKVNIVVGGWVQYDITAIAADKIDAVIDNSAEAKIYGKTVKTNELSLHPEAENVELLYHVKPNKNYKPGQLLTYNVEVSNTGGGFAHDYDVSNVLQTLAIDLANNGDTATYDHRDVVGHPFTTWTVSVQSVGDNSLSKLGKGKTLTDSNLADVVTIAPGEKITYQIKATTKTEAISTIATEVNVASEAGSNKITKSIDLAANALTDQIQITKKPLSSEYLPNDWVRYKLSAINTNTSKYADNFTIKDQIESCQLVDFSDGTQGPPFTAWKLSVDSVAGEGSDPGLFDYGTEKTGDINITADFSASGKIDYILEAKVNPLAIGTILDVGPCPDDNVDETGGGLDTPDGKAEVLKLVDKQQFVPGSQLTYSITVKNTGKGPLTNLNVYDDIAGVTSGSLTAFTAWTVRADVTDSKGAPSTFSNPDIDGTLADNRNIDTHVNIFPGDTITYTVVATTRNDLTATVTNEVKVGDDATSTVSSDPLPYVLSLRKTVDKKRYSEGDNTLVYTIRLASEPIGGFAKDIAVDDDFQNVQAELLHPNGTKVPAFESIEIETQVKGENADAGLNPDYATAGLHAKASLPAGGSVVYRVTCKIPERTQDYIVWGQVNNSVSITTDHGVQDDVATTDPKVPDVRVKKEVNKPYYHAGESVTYLIIIWNEGEGYANSLSVNDSISGLGLFKSWTYSTNAFGLGSRVITPLVDNKDIDTRVDIAPHSRIEIQVRGIVIDDISGIDKITNTVYIHDDQTGRDFDASADITKDDSQISFSVSKDGDSIHFKPGQVFTYTLGVRNDSEDDVHNLVLHDDLADINVKLANDKSGTHDDIDGTPFNRWRYKINNGDWTDWITDNILIENFTMKSHEEGTMTIEAEVKDNVVSNKIRNEVLVQRLVADKGPEDIAKAVYESLRADPGGVVSRQVTPKDYKPGDEITYTISATSHTGYYNNVAIKDAISKMQVETLDGSMKHPFNDAWTVSVEKKDSHGGGTTDGTVDGVVQDNKDLDVVIDIGGGDVVIYTIKGVVRDDAIGVIDNQGLVTNPFPPEYTYSKTTTETNYVPGSPLTYEITVNNTGKVHLQDVMVRDLLSDIRTENVDHQQVRAFTDWTITGVTAPIKENPETGAKPAYEALYDAGTLTPNHDMDAKADIPIGGSITWKVAATVNPQAAGDITNTSSINGDTTNVTNHPEVSTYKVTKSISGLFDKSMNPLAGDQYTPGGYIQYSLKIEWLTGANVVDVPVKDGLSSIKTQWFDDSKGKAFESWSIVTHVDTGGVTDPGTVADNTNIDTVVDIGVKGYIEYVITAKIMEEAVGNLINSCTVGHHNPTVGPTKMAQANLALTKEAFSDSGKSQTKGTYEPGEAFYYEIILANEGLGTYYNKHVNDMLSEIQVEIAETSATAGTKPMGRPFARWAVTENHAAGRVTNTNGYTGGIGEDIDTDIDIAPGDKITFMVRAEIAPDVLGPITNTVKSDKTSVDKTLVPKTATSTLDKSIYSIDGNRFNPSYPYYKPSDYVVYVIKVENTSGNWLNDFKVTDSISAVTTTLSDGTIGQALSDWTVTGKATSLSGSEGVTYVPEIAANTDIDVELDIAPHETVSFTIGAYIKPNAMGEIIGNQAKAGDDEDVVEPLEPLGGTLDYSKHVIMSTAGDIHYYANNGEVQFRVVVANNGAGFLKSIPIKDTFSSEISSGGEAVYKDFTVAIEDSAEYPTPVHSFISGAYEGEVDIDATANIAPGEAYSFLITAHINPDVTGSFTNLAEIDGRHISVALYPLDAVWVSQKTADQYTYAPGDTLTFTLTVTNQSDAIGTTFIDDPFSLIQIAVADGSYQPAFTAVTASYVIDGDTKNSSVTEPIMVDNNLHSTITLAGNATPEGDPTYSSVTFTVKAVVRDDAIGDIDNIADVGGENIPLPKPITPLGAQISIEKKASVDPAIYKPGDIIGFDVTLTNTGKGYSSDTHYEDLLANLLTDVAGSGTKQQAIDQWQMPTVSYSSSASFAVAGKELNDKTGYYNDFVIAPGDTVSIHIEGTVIDTALGDITNISQWSEPISSTSGQDSATYKPAPANVTLSKNAPVTIYTPGEEISFNVVLTNTGEGWSQQTPLIDDIGAIEVETLGGKLIPAFVANTLKVSHDGDPAYVAQTITGNKLEASADLAPGQVLTFTLTATVDSGAIAEIVNQATSGSQTADASVVPKKGERLLSKVAVSEPYTLGSDAIFDISLKNIGAGPLHDAVLMDEVSTLQVLTMDGSNQPPFTTWTFEILSVTGSAEAIDNTTGKVFLPTTDQDLNVTVDMLGNSEVIFRLTGTVMDKAVGDIVNQVSETYEGYTDQASAVIYPAAADTSKAKASDSATYRPTEDLSFTLTIENTSQNIIYQKSLIDDMSSVTVLLADGTEGPAFEAESTSLTPLSVPPTSIVTQESDIGYSLTIPPGDVVTFTAKGKVVANAIGKIMNSATFDTGNFDSNKVPREAPDIKGEFTVVQTYYVPGQPLEYHLKLTNASDFPAYDVGLHTAFIEAKGVYIKGGVGPAFDQEKITAETDGGPDSDPGSFSDNKDINTLLSISAGGFVEYTIKPLVSINMVTPISVKANYLFEYTPKGGKHVDPDKSPYAELLSVRNLPPPPGEIKVMKKADKPAYGQNDGEVIYTLTALNPSEANMAQISLVDALSSIKTAKGTQVFTHWTFEAFEKVNDVKTRLPDAEQPPADQDLNFIWNYESEQRNSLLIEVRAQLCDDVQEAVTNKLMAFSIERSPLDQAEVTIPIDRKPLNQGTLVINKQALQPQIKAGDIVEYEVVISNPHDSVFENFTLVDKYPTGFRYVEGSAKISYQTTGWQPMEMQVSHVLTFTPITLAARQTCKLRYLLKSTLATPYGTYKNTAEAVGEDGRSLSNESSALVAILGDKLFDTASIIGKVFVDNNCNGYQSGAVSKGVKLKAQVPVNQYVRGSTQLISTKGTVSLRENSSVPVVKGLKLGDLAPKDAKGAVSKAVLRFKATQAEPYVIEVTSASGTALYLAKDGQTKRSVSGNLKRGLGSEHLQLTRNVYKQPDAYLHEIVVENLGVSDKGIPGVKLITAEGFKLETDEHGRFHVPDRWVLDAKGRNLVIKVDEDSLPAGMKVISENPKAIRVMPNKLNKVNFSVR